MADLMIWWSSWWPEMNSLFLNIVLYVNLSCCYSLLTSYYSYTLFHPDKGQEKFHNMTYLVSVHKQGRRSMIFASLGFGAIPRGMSLISYYSKYMYHAYILDAMIMATINYAIK